MESEGRWLLVERGRRGTLGGQLPGDLQGAFLYLGAGVLSEGKRSNPWERVAEACVGWVGICESSAHLVGIG